MNADETHEKTWTRAKYELINVIRHTFADEHLACPPIAKLHDGFLIGIDSQRRKTTHRVVRRLGIVQSLVHR